MRTTRCSLIAAVAAAVLALCVAHDALAHESEQGPHGGLLVEVKGHHIELTAKGSDLTLYLTDEANAEMPSKGASGRAVVLDGAKQSIVPLAPAEPNKLLGQLEAPLSPGARVVVSLKLPNGHDVRARFVLK